METTNNLKISRVNPYMGIYTYTEYDKQYFWGRNEESSELTDIILNTTSTILTGYSGCGKSSLINAGITPRLKDYNIITIKITPKEVYKYESRDKFASEFWELVHTRINDKLNEYENEIVCINKNNVNIDYSKKKYDDISLWEKLFLCIFKKKGLKLYFLIVLDQFEELFQLDLNIKEVNRVFKIYEIMTNSYSPYYEYIQEIKKNSNTLFPKDKIYNKYSNEKTLHRFLISLRKDFLYDLQSYSGYYPVLAHNIYYLENLDDDQAREIMMACNDFKPTDNFQGLDTHKLIKTILNNKDDFDDTDGIPDYRIDTMTLSVVLYKLWEICDQKAIDPKKKEYNPRLFQKEVKFINKNISELFKNILFDFYNDRIKSLKQGSDKRNEEKKNYIKRILSNHPELINIQNQLPEIFKTFIDNSNETRLSDDKTIGFRLDSDLFKRTIKSYEDLITYIKNSVKKGRDSYEWEQTTLGDLIKMRLSSNDPLREHLNTIFNRSNANKKDLEKAAIFITDYAYGKLNDNELDDRGSNTKSIRQVLINNLKGFSLKDSINKCCNNDVKGKLLQNLNKIIYELQDKLLSDSGLYRQSAYLDDLCKLFDKAIYGEIDFKKKKEWFCNIIKNGIIDASNGLNEICGIGNNTIPKLNTNVACDIIKNITLASKNIQRNDIFDKEEDKLEPTFINNQELCNLIKNKCINVIIREDKLLCEFNSNRSIEFSNIHSKDIVCHLIQHDILKPKLINTNTDSDEEKNAFRKTINKYVYRINNSDTDNDVRKEIYNVIKNCKLFTELNKGNNENMLEFRHDRLCEMAKRNMDNYIISKNNAIRYTPNIYFTLQGRLKEPNCFVDSIFGPWNTYSSIMSTMYFMEGDKNSIVDFSSDSIHQLKRNNYDKASSAIVTIALNDRFLMDNMMDEYEDYHELPAYFTHFRVKIENDKIYNISFETRENHDSNIQKVVIPTGFHKVRFYFDEYDRIILKEFCVRKDEHKDFYTPPKNIDPEKLPNDIRVTLPETGYNAIYYQYDTVDNQCPTKSYFLNISQTEENDLRETAIKENNIKTFLNKLNHEITNNKFKYIIHHIVDGNYGFESQYDNLGREISRKFLGGTNYQFDEIKIEYDDKNNKHCNDIKSISLYLNGKKTSYRYTNKPESENNSKVHKIEFIYETNGSGRIQKTKYYDKNNKPCVDQVKKIAGEQYIYYDNDNEHFVQTVFLNLEDKRIVDANNVSYIKLSKNNEGNRVESIESFKVDDKVIDGRNIMISNNHIVYGIHKDGKFEKMMYHKIEFKHYRDKVKTYLHKVNGDRFIILNDSEVKPLKKPTKTLKIAINKDVSFKMILVEQGSFDMGHDYSKDNPKDDYRKQEKPIHKVTLNAYYIGETPVTNKIWNSIMGYTIGGDEDCPVVNVSWYDVQMFIQKLNRIKKEENLTFRLPTEAEWEFAARDGNHHSNYLYSGSNDLKKVAYVDKHGAAHTVTDEKYKANKLGIYHMSGNVKEWCEDYYGLYTTKEEVNPIGPRIGYSKVLRGGSFRSDERTCRVFHRDCAFPDTKGDNIGFRLVLEIDN